MARTLLCNSIRFLLTFTVIACLALSSGWAQLRIAAPKNAQKATSLRPSAETLQTIENGQIKVGVNTSYGGAITYLAFLDSHGGKVSTANMVNNFDRGRQVQIALYSGPIDYPGFVGLGWNPIQAGDSYGNSSEVVAIDKQPNQIYVKTIPKQWGLRSEPGEATIEHWIRLDGNVVKVHAKAVMLRSNKTQYEARQQEFPCAYLNADYHNMWLYRGNEPYTNGSLALERLQPPNKALFGDVFPTEPWMASTNDKGYGVGMYVRDNYEWKRGYFGTDFFGDEFSDPSSYIAATNRVVLDHNLVYEWDYELILGHLDEIRSYIYTKPRLAAGPNYRFDNSRKGWYYRSARDTGLPIQGKLHVDLNDASNNMGISSPYVFWKGSDNPKMYLRAAFKTQHDKLRLKWRRSDDQTIYGTGDRFMDFPINNDGQFHTYEIDLSQNTNWLNYAIGQIEFSTIPDGPAINGWAEFEWLSTSPNAPTDEPLVANPPIVDIPELVQQPPSDPCVPGCAKIVSKKIQYLMANRKR